MNFKPKSDADLSTGNLLPKGEYDFEVIGAVDKVSKANNEMIELKLLIYIDGTPARQVFDYLMESVAYKLKHFCYAVGLADKYDSGTITAFDCNNVSGRCKIGVKQDKTGQYPPNNNVTDYVVVEGNTQSAKKVQHERAGDQLTEEDLPF